MRGGRAMVVVVLMLAAGAYMAQALSLSAARQQPRYDEVHYLSLTRDYHRMGGVLPVIACHFQGQCLEDNRNPLYELVLQRFAHDDPRFFADAKLVTIGTALLLMAVSFLLARRAFGAEVAVVTVALLCLQPTLAEISSGVLADVLYATLMLATVSAIGACQARGPAAWLGAGALVGLAYLAKGNAHLALLGLVTVGLAMRGRRLATDVRPWAAVAGFAAAAAFLLWRNVAVYGSPFHSFNERAVWLDRWEDIWQVMRTPEWDRIGPGWYLAHHSLLTLIGRMVKDFGQSIGVILYTLGLGITSGTQAKLQPSVASVVIRMVTGCAVAALAVRGLVDRYRAGHRAAVLAVAHVTFWMLLAFAVGAQGVGGVATRFMLPLCVLYVPYAAHALITRVVPWLRARMGAPAAALPYLAALPLVAKLLWFGPALTVNPRSLYEVPPRWAETSAWLADHLSPGERYAIPHASLYSTWDRPSPDPDARWPYLFRVDATEMMRAIDEAKPLSIAPRWDGPHVPIRKILVDREDTLWPTYKDKLSAETDAHGPVAFLGWRRCFADSDQPSRFLVYCR
jgi:hypothetical protein